MPFFVPHRNAYPDFTRGGQLQSRIITVPHQTAFLAKGTKSVLKPMCASLQANDLTAVKTGAPRASA